MVFQYLYIGDEEDKVKAIHRAQVQSWPYPERQLSLKRRGWTQRAAQMGEQEDQSSHLPTTNEEIASPEEREIRADVGYGETI